jgi:L-alanine-DL-glutamate epimerase-like enolase superfamily enzyme
MSEEIRISAEPLSIPFKRTFRTAMRSADMSHSLIMRAEADGIIGFGESCPSSKVTGESVESVMANLPLLTEAVKGEKIDTLEDLVFVIKKIDKTIAENQSLKCGLTSALIDFYMKKHSISISSKPVRTDVTISLGKDIMAEMEERLEEGFSVLKIKIGMGIEEDAKLVKSIRDRFGYSMELILDANQSYTPNSAKNLISSLSSYDVKILEQPVPAWNKEGLRSLMGPIPIMADESLFNARDAMALSDRVDYFNIKLNKSGGIVEALRIADIAESCGLGCMVGCMGGETIVGISAGFLVASVAHLPLVDLDSPLLLKDNPVKGGVRYAKDMIMPPEGFGTGVI